MQKCYLLLIVISLINLQNAQCPSNCQKICQIPGELCINCLKPFFQVYSFLQKRCVCQNGFKHFLENQDYCCPYQCQSCGSFGCSTCDETNSYLSIVFVDFFRIGYFNCSCLENFQLNLSSRKCLCKSNDSPTNFYENQILGQCIKCPDGCLCSNQGCYQCSNESNRKIRVIQTGSYECDCVKSYKQSNGICICPNQCICSNETISFCLIDSKRTNLSNQWICNFPYIQNSGKCQCLYPYVVSQNDNCICSSNTFEINDTSIDTYQYKGICYQCLATCLCNYQGCYQCPNTGKYIVTNGSCFCNKNYSRIGSVCICGNPYYQISQGNCKCMSQLNASLYYYDLLRQKCYKCPQSCICNENGCIQCLESTLRTITLNKYLQYSCLCQQNAIENKIGKCVCKSPYYISSSKDECVCNIDSINQLIYSDPDNGFCYFCPNQCNCSTKGCFTCINSTLRNIRISSSGINICDCIQNAEQNIFNVCVCIYPYVLNESSLKCQCERPYFKVNNKCQCKSKQFPTQYYWDSLNNKCKVCPYNCVCNDFGCIACTNDSLRHIITLQTSVCLCWQQAEQIDNQCVICKQGYYYNSQCVSCADCKTCNRVGCLSCVQGFILNNYTCECLNKSLTNWNNTCVCSIGTYNNTKFCQPCPFYCNQCNFQNYQLQCLSCLQNMNRKLLPQNGCPCQDGFKQISPIKKFCCSNYCSNCDQKGCTQCYPFSFRIILNMMCQCIFPFIDTGNLYCQCSQGMYLFENQCLICPLSCKTCIFSSKYFEIQCLSCNLDNNRNVSSKKCLCQDGFLQTYPISKFCVAQYCINSTLNCTQCIFPRKIQERVCVCQDGYYQNSFKSCSTCFIKGCLKCLSYQICIQCNISDNYYLTDKTCTRRNLFKYLYTYAQDHSGVYIQFQLLEKSVSKVFYIQVKMFQIQTQQRQSPVLQNISEQAQKSILTYGNVMTIKFINANITYSNVLFSFIIRYQNFFENQNKTTQYTILHKRVFSDPFLSNFGYTNYFYGVLAYVIIIFCFAFAIYLSGYKHNQIIFTLQTFSLCVFSILHPDMMQVSVLYYLRSSYFGFGSGFFSKYISDDYIQASPRNYRFLTKDSNFFRIAGIPLIVTLIILIIISLSRLFYRIYILVNKKNKINKFKRQIVYRVFQFFYKVTMLPMLFFSFQKLFNWKIQYQFVYSIWKIASQSVSIFFIFIYFINTVFQLKFQMIPRSSKIQNLNQILSASIVSIVIISNQNIEINTFLLILIIPLLIRDIVYIYGLYKYCEVVFKSYIFIFLPSLMSIIPVVLILTTVDRNALFASIILMNFSQIIVPIYITKRLYSFFKKQKAQIQNKINKQINSETQKTLIVFISQ